MHDLPGLESARAVTPSDRPSTQSVRRALRRHVALLLLTLSVVVIPNVVAFAASIVD
jgi:hypothetical protein